MRLARAFTFNIASFLFFISPAILRRYPGPYTTSIADVLALLGDKFMQGMASFAFFTALILGAGLAFDAYRGLTGAAAPASVSPSPTQLEEGAATTTEIQPAVVEANAEGTPAAAPVPASSKKTPTLAGKIGGFLLCSGFTAWDLFVATDLVSSSKPLAENVGDVLLYLLRGWEVLFFILCLTCVAAWVHKRYLAPAAVTQAAPELLFEGTLPEENETEKKQTEKA
ncbi:hypothetical protein C8R45DRAFT_972894 [Mycena sanguinolenta]|nr:hypothetical protein C8R45DRAFT_972894 [Mycena sanguinolenta]